MPPFYIETISSCRCLNQHGLQHCIFQNNAIVYKIIPIKYVYPAIQKTDPALVLSVCFRQGCLLCDIEA